MLAFLFTFSSCMEYVCLQLDNIRECPAEFTVVKNVDDLYNINSDSFSILLIAKSVTIDLARFKDVKHFGVHSDDNTVISFDSSYAKSTIGDIELTGITLKFNEVESKAKVSFPDRFVIKNSTIDCPKGASLEISASTMTIDSDAIKSVKTIFASNLDIRLTNMLTEDLHIKHKYEGRFFYSQVSVTVPQVSSYTFTEEQNSAKIGISGCKYFLYLDYEDQLPNDVRISSNNLPAEITFMTNTNGYCGSSMWCDFSPSVFLVKSSTVIVNQSISFFELSGNISLKSTAQEAVEVSFKKMNPGSSLSCSDQKVTVSTPKLREGMENIDVASGFFIKEIESLKLLTEDDQSSERHFTNVRLNAQNFSISLNSKRLYAPISIDNLKLEGDLEVVIKNDDIDVTNKEKYNEVFGKQFCFLKAANIVGGSIRTVADPNGGLGFREDDAIYKLESSNGAYYITPYVSFDVIAPTIHMDTDFSTQIKSLNPMTKTLTVVVEDEGAVLDLSMLPHKVRLTVDGNDHDLQVMEIKSLRSKLFSLTLVNVSFNIGGTSGTSIDVPIVAKEAGLFGANFKFEETITLDEESIIKWSSLQLGKVILSLTNEASMKIGNGKIEFEDYGTLTSSDVSVVSNGNAVTVERADGDVTPVSFYSGQFDLVVGTSFDGKEGQPIQIISSSDDGKININLKTKASPVKFVNSLSNGKSISAFIYAENTHEPVAMDEFKLNGVMDVSPEEDGQTAVPINIKNFFAAGATNGVLSNQNLKIENVDMSEGSSLTASMITVSRNIKIRDGSSFEPMEATISNTNPIFITKVNTVPGEILFALENQYENITIKHATSGVKIDGKYIDRWFPLIHLSKEKCNEHLSKVKFIPSSIPVGENNVTFEAGCRFYDKNEYVLSLIRHVSPLEDDDSTNSDYNGGDDENTALFYGLMIGGALLVVAGVALFIYCFIKRKKLKKQDYSDAIMSQLL